MLTIISKIAMIFVAVFAFATVIFSFKSGHKNEIRYHICDILFDFSLLIEMICDYIESHWYVTLIAIYLLIAIIIKSSARLYKKMHEQMDTTQIG